VAAAEAVEAAAEAAAEAVAEARLHPRPVAAPFDAMSSACARWSAAALAAPRARAPKSPEPAGSS
jgi:hypothetical protein